MDFDQRYIVVRSGKGDKDRVTLLPGTVIEQLQTHMEGVRIIHDQDLAEGFGSVQMPDALARK